MSLDGEERPIFVKKIPPPPPPGHGGAWKVAYADFVTAMMAFFLLLWLLNATTADQKQGVANYFEPSGALRGSSGSGGVFGGVSMSDPGVEQQPAETEERTVGSESQVEKACDNIVVNEISSSDSTAVQINDTLNVNTISSSDSTEVTVEDGLNEVYGPFDSWDAANDYIDEEDLDAAFVSEVTIVEKSDDDDEDDEDEEWDDNEDD